MAQACGARYRPDWEELKGRTGNQQRWCETVWRDAKRMAVQLSAARANNTEVSEAEQEPAADVLGSLADWDPSGDGQAVALKHANGHGAQGGEAP